MEAKNLLELSQIKEKTFGFDAVEMAAYTDKDGTVHVRPNCCFKGRKTLGPKTLGEAYGHLCPTSLQSSHILYWSKWSRVDETVDQFHKLEVSDLQLYQKLISDHLTFEGKTNKEICEQINRIRMFSAFKSWGELGGGKWGFSEPTVRDLGWTRNAMTLLKKAAKREMEKLKKLPLKDLVEALAIPENLYLPQTPETRGAYNLKVTRAAKEAWEEYIQDEHPWLVWLNAASAEKIHLIEVLYGSDDHFVTVPAILAEELQRKGRVRMMASIKGLDPGVIETARILVKDACGGQSHWPASGKYGDLKVALEAAKALEK